jgi:hypothetical protein
MMKPQNQTRIVPLGILSCKSLLHGVEEMREGQLGTTIDDDDLKYLDKTQAESAIVQYSSVQFKYV